ncbi:flagellar basal-body rod protein FlgC [Nocardioides humilatus]|uniref:Flagellar basal-body rod protein FlgC n=1 Tax=Nocardioides humilatus TaxID=2607660 RepID=A0A5B1LD83_9ACTN|nr:flagellar basal body rod C-terminal domain-containing protein [Nocardioides humilatus]KAA1417709.1 flagellar basal-body rod protein FlgC [Nocardioides humilatus]
MSAFDALSIANSALGAHQTWLDALAGNIANANTITSTDDEAFQATYVIFQSQAGGGVDVAGFAGSDPEGVLVQDPANPLADEDGFVRAPAMDMSSEMSQLIMAQRGFQASVQVTKTAQDTYAAALQIGGR